MIKWLRLRNTTKVDEHDEPTEPLLPIVLPSPPAEERTEPSGEEELPVPQLHVQFWPGQQVHKAQQPPAPTNPHAPSAITGENSKQTSRGTAPPQLRRNPLPLLAGMCFVMLQLLLLVRFLLKLLDVSASDWVGTFYAISGVFIIPFRLIVPDIIAPFRIDIEVYTLLAVLVYGLLSHLLVRLLKLFLRQR